MEMGVYTTHTHKVTAQSDSLPVLAADHDDDDVVQG